MVPGGAGAPALAGRRVLLTRSPDRAGAMARALARAGAEPLLLPVIDFERAEDPAALASALDRLAAGDYAWLVVSSITTVRALKEAAAARGTTLAELVPEGVQVATIGPSSRRVLEAEGLRVDLAPTGRQSAEGLVELWSWLDDGAAGADGAGIARVLIPQSNLAAPTLAEGLVAKGWAVETVTAYRTVDYPADPDRRLTAALAAAAVEGGQDAQEAPGVVLTPHEANGELAAGRIDAVVAASPSAARRIHETLRPLDAVQLIAIGEPTAAELRALGLAVGATAATPTPEGITEAVARSLYR
ncbi:uroporphyrinogen-III synthase [Sinomonas atrocyanea]|uniref:uroporphyrinogen-III synthase n=1 Tax=Sinomonas atrocyanea TaxID=37927 RepID=UPI00277DB493|nr:uroporphyrinogen-III synthase [Sinomonas atrocyanea]MDP9885399.1 uroporphyrinogen-III synthase [Sinomonas atrocyanea]